MERQIQELAHLNEILEECTRVSGRAEVFFQDPNGNPDLSMLEWFLAALSRSAGRCLDAVDPLPSPDQRHRLRVQIEASNAAIDHALDAFYAANPKRWWGHLIQDMEYEAVSKLLLLRSKNDKRLGRLEEKNRNHGNPKTGPYKSVLIW